MLLYSKAQDYALHECKKRGNVRTVSAAHTILKQSSRLHKYCVTSISSCQIKYIFFSPLNTLSEVRHTVTVPRWPGKASCFLD